MSKFTESEVEEAALYYFEQLLHLQGTFFARGSNKGQSK